MITATFTFVVETFEEAERLRSEMYGTRWGDKVIFDRAVESSRTEIEAIEQLNRDLTFQE